MYICTYTCTYICIHTRPGDGDRSPTAAVERFVQAVAGCVCLNAAVGKGQRRDETAGVCICMYMNVYVCIQIYMYVAYIHMYMYIYVCAYIYIFSTRTCPF